MKKVLIVIAVIVALVVFGAIVLTVVGGLITASNMMDMAEVREDCINQYESVHGVPFDSANEAAQDFKMQCAEAKIEEMMTSE